MKRNVLIIGLMFCIGFLNAQTDFRKGYIIESNGDTIFGKIDYQGNISMSGVCRFKKIDNTITEYTPNDIQAYRFIDSKYYISKEINNKKVFLEYLIKGKINLYFLCDDIGDHYYIDKNGAKFIKIPYEEKIKYNDDDNKVQYTSTKHNGILSYYMQDAPQLQSEILNIKKPDYKSLVDIVKNYNNSVCNNERCIIYEKKLPFLNINLEPFVGIIKYVNANSGYDISKIYSKLGIIAHIWLPRENENLYLRTGIQYARVTENGGKIDLYQIPFQLEYIYSSGVFRPIISYGVNIHFPYYMSDYLNLGANIKLNNTLFFNVTSEIEFYNIDEMPIIPKGIFSYSFKVGLFVKFKK